MMLKDIALLDRLYNEAVNEGMNADTAFEYAHCQLQKVHNEREVQCH